MDNLTATYKPTLEAAELAAEKLQFIDIVTPLI